MKAPGMNRKKAKNAKADKNLVRASISFPPDLYQILEDLARQKKVSLAWVVREAAERYVTEQQLTAASLKAR